MNENPQPSNGKNGSTPPTVKSINSYLHQLQVALGQEMSRERIALYLQGLADLSEADLKDAFRVALKSTRTNERGFVALPQIGDLRRWAEEGRQTRHQRLAQERTQVLLDRADKPDDWNFKLDEAWEQVELKAELQWQEDLRHPDLPWEEAKAQKMKYVAWHRRHETHDLHNRGIARPAARNRYGKRFEETLAKGIE